MMHTSLITCLVVMTARAQLIAPDCAQLCESTVYRESSESGPHVCVCSSEAPVFQQQKLDDSGIYFEPAEVYTLRQLPYVQPPFFILNPAFKLQIQTRVPKVLRKRKLTQEHYNQNITNKNNQRVKTSKVNFENNKRPVYLDIDVHDPDTERSSQNTVRESERYQLTEKVFAECVDLHMLLNSKSNTTRAFEVEGKYNYTRSDILNAIKKKCKQPIDIVKQSLHEIKENWSKIKNSSGELSKSLKWIDVAENQNRDHSTENISHSADRVNMLTPYPTELEETNSSYTINYNNNTHFNIDVSEANTFPILITETTDVHQTENYASNKLPETVELRNSDEKLTTTKTFTQAIDNELVKSTQYRGEIDENNFNNHHLITTTETARQPAITYTSFDTSEIAKATLDEGSTIPEEAIKEENYNITNFSTEITFDSGTKNILSIEEYKTKSKSISTPSTLPIQNYSDSYVEENNLLLSYTQVTRDDVIIQTTNKYLVQQTTTPEMFFEEDNDNMITESLQNPKLIENKNSENVIVDYTERVEENSGSLTAVTERYRDDEKTMTSYTVPEKERTIITTGSSYDSENNEETEETEETTQLIQQTTELNYFPTADMHTVDSKYNIKIPKVLTREFQNDTVISELHGTEILPNNDFTESYLDNTTNNVTNEDPLSEDKDLSSVSSSTKNESVKGNLYFLFNEVNIPARFVQEADGDLTIGLDGTTLCNNVTSQKNSSLFLNIMCKSYKNSLQ